MPIPNWMGIGMGVLAKLALKYNFCFTIRRENKSIDDDTICLRYSFGLHTLQPMQSISSLGHKNQKKCKSLPRPQDMGSFAFFEKQKKNTIFSSKSSLCANFVLQNLSFSTVQDRDDHRNVDLSDYLYLRVIYRIIHKWRNID